AAGVNRLEPTAWEGGCRWSGRAIAASMRATSATVRAIGPATPRVSQTNARGCDGTSPGVVRKPTTPQKDAGTRRDPPRSEPWARGPMPVATPTAAPPLEPPQVSAGFQGLRVAPNTALKVFPPAPNSGLLVLPITMAPAALSRWTTRSSSSGTWSL